MLFNNSYLSELTDEDTRSITAENFTGERGKGGMALEGTGAKNLGQGWKISPSIIIKPGETFTLADIRGEGMIRRIWAVDACQRNRTLIFRIYWDGSEIPSVEAPMCDFFACADYQKYTQMTSAMVCLNPKRTFNCFWEMPFYKEAKITVENLEDSDACVYYQIDYALYTLPKNLGYFHAQFRRSNPLTKGECHTILDNVHGKGKYVGTYMFWRIVNPGWWGEGEVKFYLDGDREFPTICGTGMEDYFLGSWGFDENGYREFCTPYGGLAKYIKSDKDERFSMYRWHIPDPIVFKSDIKVTIQDLGWCSDGYEARTDDISSVAYWYQDSICDTFPKFPTPSELEIESEGAKLNIQIK